MNINIYIIYLHIYNIFSKYILNINIYRMCVSLYIHNKYTQYTHIM